MKKIVIIIYSACLLFSCSEVEDKNYDGLFLITELSLEGDSIIENKSRQFHSQVSIEGFNQKWNKKFFVKTYETLDKPTYTYYDSLLFDTQFNTNGELIRVNNWKQIYSKAEEGVLEITNGEPVTDPILQDFINNVCLDSSLIINKNTKEISLFNIGYTYLLDSTGFIKNNPDYSINYENNLTVISTGKINATNKLKDITDPILSSLGMENEGNVSESQEEIQIVIFNKRIIRAFHKISIWIDGSGPYSREFYMTEE